MFKGRIIQSLDNQVSKEPDLVPKLPFSGYLSSSKGSGKSVTLINMLKSKDLLGGKFNEIYIVNPTSHLDLKWSSIKNVKGILKTNKILIKLMKKEHSKIFDTLAEKTTENYNTEITDDNFIKTVSIKLIEDLIAEQDYIIKTYGKENANNILVCYDDCISHRNFFKSESILTCLFLSRHYKISLIITSQNYKTMPLALRNNMSFICLWITYNTDQLKAIYEENGVSGNFKQFLEIYKTTCEFKPFHFMVINYQNPPAFRLQSGFEEFIKHT